MENIKCEDCEDKGITPGGVESGQSDEWIPEKKCHCTIEREEDVNL